MPRELATGRTLRTAGALASGRALAVARAATFYLLGPFHFTPAESAPLASPYTESGAVGALTLVQTDGQFSASGGAMAFPSQGSPVEGDLGFYSGAGLSRLAGRVLQMTINLSSVAANKYVRVLNWTSNPRVPTSAQVSGDLEASVLFSTTSTDGILYRRGAVFPVVAPVVTISVATDYQLALALRNAGAFLLIKGGVFANWTLLWVDDAGSVATLYPMVSNFSLAGTLDNFRVTDLSAPWSTDFGIATQRLAGARSTGDTFSHEANCHIEFIATTLPSSSVISLRFRSVDNNNFWKVNIGTTGTLSLVEQVAGVDTTRGTAASVVANSHRVVIIADGTTIRGYSNNVLRWTYSSASNFQTATAGELTTLGTGGAVSDIVSWPRTLTGAALAGLNGV